MRRRALQPVRERRFSLKRQLHVLVFLLVTPIFLLSQGAPAEPREIKNLLSEVKKARAGDYIVLQSGKRYVLTQNDIDVANGKADYDDLSGVKTETRRDGTEVKTLSEGHTAYTYEDGQSTHVLKTGVSFASYKEYIEKKYHLVKFVNSNQTRSDYKIIDAPRFDVFRASAEFQKYSNGANETEFVTITVYNYNGKNFMMRYSAQQGFVWGFVKGTYSPTGESHQVEFGTE